ncbi:Uncharacterised protein [Vibrio cholerae]|nr:Uncharacterised protein [Vibrio cholerae]
MWVSLMTHIPDQMIKWGVVDVMQRNRQLNGA